MKSLASLLVQQLYYNRPKNLANYRPAEPSHNMKDWGAQCMRLEDFTDASLAGHKKGTLISHYNKPNQTPTN